MTDMDTDVRGRLVWSKHIVGVKEGAAFFDVNPSAFSQWANRRKFIGMPEPLFTLGSGTFYDLQELLDWHWNWVAVKSAKVGTIDENLIKAMGLIHPGGERWGSGL